MNPAKILCIDDEPNVLVGLEYGLSWDFEVVTAVGGAEGLERLRESAASSPFNVVISDMRMPEMDGATFLTHVADEFPDITRMLLTGYSDIESAMRAINEGRIFRMLLKPCPVDILTRAVKEAVRQNELVRAERELLDHTLRGAVEALIDALALASPFVFSRSKNIRNLVRYLGESIAYPALWELEMAAMFALVGLIAVPEETSQKFLLGTALTPDEVSIVEGYPEVGYKLLERVPRLGRVATLVKYHNKPSTSPPDLNLDVGLTLLNAAVVYDRSMLRGDSLSSAASALNSAGVPPEIRDRFASFHPAKNESNVRMVELDALIPNMILDQDIVSEAGQILVKAGTELNLVRIEWLRNYSRGGGVVTPIRVQVNV
jgi:CheY-like chemotaxis protein